jgi:hypothetical protein
MNTACKVASAIAIATGAGLLSRADEPTTSELMEQIKTLQQRVQQLEQKQDQATHSRDIDQITREVLADANQRSQLLQSEGFTAGYHDGQFLLKSADDNFVFHPWFWMQFRNTSTFREDVGTSDDNDLQNGFELRRVKFGFDGNVFSPDLSYYVKFAVDRKSGDVDLEEAWAKFRLNDLLAIKAGQMKGPFAHDSYITARKLLAAERTLLTDDFVGGTDYLQGVSFVLNEALKRCPIRGQVMVTDGSKNNANQNFQDFPANNADFGFEGRVEYFATGTPRQYEDYSAMNNKSDLLVFGGGLAFTEAGNTNLFLQTVDAQYENTQGLGVYGAFYGRYTHNAPVGTNPTPPAVAPKENDLYDWGFIAQAGYMIVPKWEPFVRYSFIDYDSDGFAAEIENQVHEIALGVNYYLHGHNAKFTLDATWLPNGSPINDDGAGILANNGDPEFIVRAQFQLSI